MPEEEQKEARRNLLKYCELDTYAVVKVWEELVRVGGEGMSEKESYKEAKENFKNKYKNLNKEDLIIEAEKYAWNDLYLLNFNNISKITKTEGEKDEIFKEMKKSFEKMLKSPYKSAEDFDNKHKLACANFLDLLAKKTEQESEKIHNNYYGKAQKFINMTFKYLLTTGRYDENVFRWCHMPLDVYTLHWFYRETGIFIEGWSSIKEDVYYEMQKIIRSRIQLKKNELSVLQNEFLIWEQEKKAVKKCAVLTNEDLKNG